MDHPSSGPSGSASWAKDFLQRSLGHYTVLEKLGEGGMGVVFKARDERLNRLVAIKVLHPDAVRDPRARQRFTQEARTASALNHPNIVHIYDTGSQDGHDFIAMEYVQGQPLNRLIRHRPLDWRTALKYGIQIAAALDASHTAGILHRDLKPGNIMLAESGGSTPGLVKVLDFGLAKLLEQDEREADRDPDLAETLTERNSITSRGLAVGTPLYMSPEQTAGRELDPRSDIFSFGVVLYQTVTGETPFRGDSHAAVMAAVLRDDPKPPTQMFPQTPLEVERVILRCLRKDPDRRFQSMREVRLALEDILEQPVTLPSQTGAAALRKRRARFAWTVAGALLLAGAAGAAWWRFAGSPPPVPEASLTRLTSDSGLATDPALSPDGKLVAYASDRSGEDHLSIWLQQTGGGEPVRLTHESSNDSQPDFSPDGTRIVFRSDRDGGGIYEISALGGVERKLVQGDSHRPRYSPTGNWIAYWTGFTPIARPGTKLHIVDPTRGLVRDVAANFASAAYPVWSPDGQYLLFLGRKTAEDGRSAPSYGWWVAPLNGGAPVQVTAHSLAHDIVQGSMPWFWKRNLIVYNSERVAGKSGVFEIPFSTRGWEINGTPRRLTPGMADDEAPSFSADGRMAFSSIANNLDIYSLKLDANRGKILAPPDRLTRDVADDFMPSVSLDGRRLAFVSSRAGKNALWTKDLESGREALLKPLDRVPFLSADGSLVYSNEDDAKRIIATPFEGGGARLVCPDCGYIAALSSNGTSLLFTDYSGHSAIGVFTIATDRKTVIRHSRFSALPRAISPDEHWIVASVEYPPQMFLLPFHPERPTTDDEWRPIAGEAYGGLAPQWSPDGDLLYFISGYDGHSCVWAQRFAGPDKHRVGEPFAVAHFHGTLSIRHPDEAFSLGRNKLTVSLDERTGNIWWTGANAR